MTMRERIAKRVFEKCYPGAVWGSAVVINGGADFLEIAAAVLAELQTPTDGMIEDGAVGLLQAQGYDIEKLGYYEDGTDKNVTKVEFEHAFHAAICAAREGK